MKPFNLEAVLLGAPVITRAGQRNVKISGYSLNEAHGNYPLRGLVDGEICSWTSEGSFLSDWKETPLDLFIASTKQSRKIWVNVYANYVIGYSSEQKALDNANSETSPVAIPITLEWEE